MCSENKSSQDDQGRVCIKKKCLKLCSFKVDSSMDVIWRNEIKHSNNNLINQFNKK